MKNGTGDPTMATAGAVVVVSIAIEVAK
jgi:hypothetical protein